MRCSKCGAENPPGCKFCGECGSPFAVRCPKCGEENGSPFRFCRSCGTALANNRHPAPDSIATTTNLAIAPERDDETAKDGERKTITALFADIKGSMDLMEDLDPEEARAIVDPALKLMMDAVHHYGGYVAQSTGDGIFALFGAPIAHEDHPQRALFAALRMQDEMRRYSSKLREAGNPPLEARVGVNTGEAVVRTIKTGDGHTEYTPIGHSTSLASRMQTLAPTGSIATTETTQKLCAGYFLFKALGPTRVKGVAEQINVFEVTGLGPLRTRLQRSAGRGLTRFVGRLREMDAMRHAAELARAGRGQIVAAIAEAGIGKSRLFFEFKATSQPGWMILEAFSVSHGKASAFMPVIDLLWGYFKISSDDDERTRREKVTGRVLALDRSLEDALPYLYGLLGLSDDNHRIADIEAQTRKRRSLDAVKRILLRESLNQPLMIILEDLHWVDEETQAFLNLLAESIGTARILLLVNYRPEYSHQWNSKTYYTQLRLDPLGLESADEMLSAMLGDGKDVATLKRLIIEKTEGNPFFMEETVLVLLDDGALVRNGSVKLTRPLRELKIPPTVQDILSARIDRLPADQKALLQTLAVIGMEFQLGVVRRVWQRNRPSEPGLDGKRSNSRPFSLLRDEPEEHRSELDQMLSELQLGEFIYEQPAAGDVEYVFKHALTHDVAYKSVLNERRRSLHARIGAALESMYADSLSDHVIELAHHYTRSSDPTRGVKYCLSAIRQFANRGSNAEAVAQFETGIELLRKLPDDDEHAELELDLRYAAGGPLGDSKGFASFEVEQSFVRASELCKRSGINWEKTWRALFGIFFVHQLRPDVRKAELTAIELIARAEEHEVVALVAEASNWLAYANMVSGNFESALLCHDRAWSLLESIEKPASGLKTAPARKMDQARTIERLGTRQNNRILSGWNLWFLGYPDRALERLKTATEIAYSGPKTMLADIHGFATYIFELRRESDQMRARAEARLLLSTEGGYATGRALSEIYLGWADALAGDQTAGIARMKRHLLELKATGSEYINDRCLAFLATAQGQAGQFAEGLVTIDESFPFLERTGQRYYEAELHRLKGELLLGQDAANTRGAENSFRTAIEISRRQHARSWELRATTSLARLLAKNNRRDDACALLAEIYHWFSEGFETADLKDAKALLDQLSS
jgi:class 3 adenylate cyclase